MSDEVSSDVEVAEMLESWAEWCVQSDVLLASPDLAPLLLGAALWIEKGGQQKGKRRLTSSLEKLGAELEARNPEDTMVRLARSLLEKKKLTSRKRKSPRKRKLFNRNPAVNALLEEEMGNDNYEDLADFIDPTPDHSLKHLKEF